MSISEHAPSIHNIAFNINHKQKITSVKIHKNRCTPLIATINNSKEKKEEKNQS